MKRCPSRWPSALLLATLCLWEQQTTRSWPDQDLQQTTSITRSLAWDGQPVSALLTLIIVRLPRDLSTYLLEWSAARPVLEPWPVLEKSRDQTHTYTNKISGFLFPLWRILEMSHMSLFLFWFFFPLCFFVYVPLLSGSFVPTVFGFCDHIV